MVEFLAVDPNVEDTRLANLLRQAKRDDLTWLALFAKTNQFPVASMQSLAEQVRIEKGEQ